MSYKIRCHNPWYMHNCFNTPERHNREHKNRCDYFFKYCGDQNPQLVQTEPDHTDKHAKKSELNGKEDEGLSWAAAMMLVIPICVCIVIFFIPTTPTKKKKKRKKLPESISKLERDGQRW